MSSAGESSVQRRSSGHGSRRKAHEEKKADDGEDTEHGGSEWQPRQASPGRVLAREQEDYCALIEAAAGRQKAMDPTLDTGASVDRGEEVSEDMAMAVGGSQWPARSAGLPEVPVEVEGPDRQEVSPGMVQAAARLSLLHDAGHAVEVAQLRDQLVMSLVRVLLRNYMQSWRTWAKMLKSNMALDGLSQKTQKEGMNQTDTKSETSRVQLPRSLIQLRTAHQRAPVTPEERSMLIAPELTPNASSKGSVGSPVGDTEDRSEGDTEDRSEGEVKGYIQNQVWLTARYMQSSGVPMEYQTVASKVADEALRLRKEAGTSGRDLEEGVEPWAEGITGSGLGPRQGSPGDAVCSLTHVMPAHCTVHVLHTAL